MAIPSPILGRHESELQVWSVELSCSPFWASLFHSLRLYELCGRFFLTPLFLHMWAVWTISGDGEFSLHAVMHGRKTYHSRRGGE